MPTGLVIPVVVCNCVMQEIALRTPGFAGADLANLLNEAAILAGGRKSLPAVRNQEIDEAVDRWVGDCVTDWHEGRCLRVLNVYISMAVCRLGSACYIELPVLSRNMYECE